MWWWVTEQQAAVPSVAAVAVLLREELQRQLAGRGRRGRYELLQRWRWPDVLRGAKLLEV